jgi:hypothetical protein
MLSIMRLLLRLLPRADLFRGMIACAIILTRGGLLPESINNPTLDGKTVVRAKRTDSRHVRFALPSPTRRSIVDRPATRISDPGQRGKGRATVEQRELHVGDRVHISTFAAKTRKLLPRVFPESTDNQRLFTDYVDAWLAMLISAGHPARVRIGHRTAIRHAISRSLTRQLKDFARVGAVDFFKKVKAFSVSCREVWIGSNTRGIVHADLILPSSFQSQNHVQLSMIARALPRLPLYLGAKKAIQEQNERLTSRRIAKSDHISRTVGELPKIIRRAVADTSSPAACVQAKRSEGGRAWFYTTCAALENPVGLKKRPGLAVQQAVASKMDFHLDSESLVVSEFGSKFRVVTKSCALRVAQSELWRLPMLASLKSKHEIGDPLRGIEIEYDLTPTLRSTSKRWSRLELLVFSADLTAATDYLSSDCLTAIADAVGFPPTLVTGGTIDGLEVVNGTLMGIPLSWPCLSLTHFSYITEVVKAPRGTFRLKGDDLIALWPLSMINFYFDHLEEYTGMVPNRLKSFIGPKRGIFCEKAYERSGSVLRMSKTQVSLRAIVCAWTPEGATTAIPEQLAAGVYLTQQIERIGHSRAYRLLRQIRPDLYGKLARSKAARKSGAVRAIGYLPLQLGGLSLIPKSPAFVFPRVLSHFLTKYHNLDPEARSILRSAQSERFADRTVQKLVPQRLGPSLRLARDPPEWAVEIVTRAITNVTQDVVALGAKYDKVRIRPYLKSVRSLAGKIAAMSISSTPLSWTWQSVHELSHRIKEVFSMPHTKMKLLSRFASRARHYTHALENELVSEVARPCHYFGVSTEEAESLKQAFLSSTTDEPTDNGSHAASAGGETPPETDLADVIGGHIQWDTIGSDTAATVLQLKRAVDAMTTINEIVAHVGSGHRIVDAVPRSRLRPAEVIKQAKALFAIPDVYTTSRALVDLRDPQPKVIFRSPGRDKLVVILPVSTGS